MISAANHDLTRLISALADQRTRAVEAGSLAQRVGARDLVVLLRDPELSILRPAPGFAQTLAGGPTWAELFARCESAGEFRTKVLHGDVQQLQPADVWIGPDGTVLLLIGGEPQVRARDLADASELLFALLQSEAREDAAVASARSAGDVTRRATALAASLDQARAQLARNAGALHEALSEAARLNGELHLLNETLEQRVREEIAERTKAEDALRQAQKMEAIGQLTGGVAHDFNNLLTVILGGLETVSRQVDELPESSQAVRIQRAADMAAKGAQRAATLTARLLAFSRRQALNPKPVDVGRLATGIADMLQRTLGETITIETISGAGLWLTHVDPSELENSLVNLAVNARDAMPTGGKLTIETGNASLDDDYVAALAEPVVAGQYVLVAVTDTGVGMDSETLDKVFEPFFTTKDVGKGTGLGLSQVYGFVRQTGGHVRVYSEPGEGTTVKLYLPRYTGRARPVEIVNQVVEEAPRGDETILVVEDHHDLRAYSVGVLRDLGYQVMEAATAAEALAIIDGGIPIDLLFTDVVLPEGLDGRRLADQVTRRRRGVKVLFTTGYTRNAIVHNGRLDPGVQLIGKPFTSGALAVKVRQVLDRD